MTAPSPTPFRSTTRLQTLLGLVVPLCVGLLGLTWLENASISVDATLRDEFDLRLATEQPEIVVLGNSITAKGLDEAQLEEIWGREVAVLAIASSEAPAWYAALKDRVYAPGYRPRVVIVVNSIESLLSVDASSSKDLMFLEQMMDGPDPILLEKVLYRTSDTPRWDNLSYQRSKLRRSALDGWRNLMGQLTVGRVSLIAASNSVFDDEKINYGRATGTPDIPVKARVIETARGSLLPDLLDLTDAHGSRFYFARVPISPGAANTASMRLQRELLDLLNERGAGFVGATIQMRALEFEDTLHLNATGRERFTRHLAEEFLALGINDEAPIPAAVMPYEEPSLVRKGEGPLAIRLARLKPIPGTCAVEAALGPFSSLLPTNLERAGLPVALPWRVMADDVELRRIESRRALLRECVPGTYAIRNNRLDLVLSASSLQGGDLRVELSEQLAVSSGRFGEITWVYPGTTLVVTGEAVWEPSRGAMAVGVFTQSFGGNGGAPGLVLGKRAPVPLEGHGGLRVARLRPPKNDTDWRVTIRSPPDGPFLALYGLTLGKGVNEVSFFNSGRNTSFVAFNVLGRDFANVQMRYQTFPPPVPGRPTLQWTDTGIGFYDLPQLDTLSDLETGRHSPLAVLEDGALLRRHVRCEEVDKRPGTQCHAEGQIRFHPSEPGEHDYALVFDRSPNFARRTEVWALPGDQIEVGFGREELRRFFEGPGRIEAMAEPFPYVEASGKVWLTLRAGDRVLGRKGFTPDELALGVSMPLKQRVAPKTPSLTLEVFNKSGVPMLVQRVTVVERLVP